MNKYSSSMVNLIVGFSTVFFFTAIVSTERSAEFRTNSPTGVFQEYRLAFETGDWQKAVRDCSPGMQKYLLFESFFIAWESSERVVTEHEIVIQKHGLDLEQISVQLETEFANKEREPTPDDFNEAILSRLNNVEAFLADVMPVVTSRQSAYTSELTELEIEGERAKAKAQGLLYSLEKSESGESREHVTAYPEIVYFRKYPGKNGTHRWKLCLKQEWEDPNFRLIIK